MTDSQTLTLRPPVWALLAAVIIGGVFYIGGKKIENRNPTPSTISVSGEGKVTAVPDIAEMSFGVKVERQPSAKLAMEKLSIQMNAVVDTIKKTGIDEKDIATEQLSLNPVYDWSNNVQTLRGYEAMQTLRVKVRDLDKTSDVLGAATTGGANQAGGVQFTIDDPEELRAQARAEAITKAKAKAQVLADQLGMTLGKVQGFSESSGGGMPPIMYARGVENMAMDGAQAAPPLPAGEQDITAQVSITYQLK